MNDVNDVVAARPQRMMTLPLAPDVSASLRKSPLKIKVIFWLFLALIVIGTAVSAYMHPEGAQEYRFFGVLTFILWWPLRIVLNKVLLGRAVGSVSRELTDRLGQSESFRNVLSETLMQTPWSEHRVTRGRYKEARFEDIMVLFRDGSHTSMNVARDLSSISIAPPDKII